MRLHIKVKLVPSRILQTCIRHIYGHGKSHVSNCGEWEELVDPRFADIVKCLQPCLVMDGLRSRGLLSRQEFDELGSLPTELHRSRELINNILPRKGPGSLDKFCDVLLKVPGQAYIVTEFIRGPPPTTVDTGSSSQGSSTHQGTPSVGQGRKQKRTKRPRTHQESASPNQGSKRKRKVGSLPGNSSKV